MEPSLEKVLEGAGSEAGSKEAAVRSEPKRPQAALAQAPRMLGETVFWKNLISP